MSGKAVCCYINLSCIYLLEANEHETIGQEKQRLFHGNVPSFENYIWNVKKKKNWETLEYNYVKFDNFVSHWLFFLFSRHEKSISLHWECFKILKQWFYILVISVSVKSTVTSLFPFVVLRVRIGSVQSLLVLPIFCLSVGDRARGTDACCKRWLMGTNSSHPCQHINTTDSYQCVFHVTVTLHTVCRF